MLIPFATADQVEQLAEAPETVSARMLMLLPDEHSTLDVPDATPILHTTRVTHGTNERPLILEELRASADRAQLAYRIAAHAIHGLHSI
ncbi:hypothetical protein PS467_13385 [Streptomyces luomodiensis]|uniref:Uncharacterized protein n=1 Tax=Streptomyces luomodiensis TaxID=3026192 RepID=A0ABY9UUM4_9ACTN|nr:hypothetical protein [Streptomyces sp. SCA4-21]WNE96257.1 hypothetical protein PS467_13385 [Streptomyces sp. SCA4-21]